MCQAVSYKRSKTMKNYNAVTSKSGGGRLREVVIYDTFQLQDFDWEKLGVWDRWSLIYGRWSFTKGGGLTVVMMIMMMTMIMFQ